ncbi:GNAT family N-acetyltransferase [Luteibaculum oceani]|uniref:GNAT family N-acetyltransferase n=1 Tax=Luteibaculum oceani TaxID=1294296 RepID=A0A5C6VKH9_9FLAO|nr:GNAT family protein [Luteibaculum oceani]TXC85164.1 GNAT family N-acetyltransferase [Luteibaculum oceani]
MKNPIAATPRFFLSTIAQTDIEFVFEGLSDPDVTRYYDVHFNSLRSTQEQMDWYDNLLETKTGKWWCIIEKGSNKFVGAGGFNNVDYENKKAEIGFWVLKKYWGKGIMKEVMPLILKMGFTEFNLNRIEGYVDCLNAACKNAISKVGFHHEGTLRSAEIKEGRDIDIDIYSILREEFMKD